MTLFSSLLIAVGLTVLIVAPSHGPVAKVRDEAAAALRLVRLDGLLSCYICLGFWVGLGVGLAGDDLLAVWLGTPALLWFGVVPRGGGCGKGVVKSIAKA